MSTPNLVAGLRLIGNDALYADESARQLCGDAADEIERLRSLIARPDYVLVGTQLVNLHAIVSVELEARLQAQPGVPEISATRPVLITFSGAQGVYGGEHAEALRQFLSRPANYAVRRTPLGTVVLLDSRVDVAATNGEVVPAPSKLIL